MLAEKFFLILESLIRSQAHADGSPRVVSSSPHIPSHVADSEIARSPTKNPARRPGDRKYTFSSMTALKRKSLRASVQFVTLEPARSCKSDPKART